MLSGHHDGSGAVYIPRCEGHSLSMKALGLMVARSSSITALCIKPRKAAMLLLLGRQKDEVMIGHRDGRSGAKMTSLWRRENREENGGVGGRGERIRRWPLSMPSYHNGQLYTSSRSEYQREERWPLITLPYITPYGVRTIVNGAIQYFLQKTDAKISYVASRNCQTVNYILHSSCYHLTQRCVLAEPALTERLLNLQ
jgi:hypothetical protein